MYVAAVAVLYIGRERESDEAEFARGELIRPIIANPPPSSVADWHDRSFHQRD